MRITFLFLTLLTISVIAVSSEPYYYYLVRNSDVDKKVAAFYYGWYSNSTDFSRTTPYEVKDDSEWRHWNFAERGYYPPANACSTHTPLFGWYDSSDPDVIAQHFKWAEWAGLDAFIISFWGYDGFEFDNFKIMMNVAKELNTSVKLTLYFEIFMKGLNKLPEDEAVDIMVDQLTVVYDYLNDSSNRDYVWLEDNKPVLFTYVSQAVSANVWTRVISNLTASHRVFFLCADRPGGSEDYNKNFQASHQYDAYAPTKHGSYFGDILNLKFNANKYGQIFAAPVTPGYDDRVVRDGNEPLDRQNGELYKDVWSNAISLRPDWITITSWNEWHEGTEIEPSRENGFLALNQTREFIREFKSEQYTTLRIKSYTEFIPIYHEIIALIAAWLIFIAYSSIGKISKYTIPKKGILGILSIFQLAPWAGLVYLLNSTTDLGEVISITAGYYIYLIPILTLISIIFPHIIEKAGNSATEKENTSKKD